MNMGTNRGRTRERIAQVARDADTMREYEVRLGLATPGELASSICKAVRQGFSASQTDMAAAMDTTPSVISHWETGERTPTFVPLVQYLIAECRLLATTGLTSRDYDPRNGLIGRILTCGVMTREEIVTALETLATVMAVDPALPEAADAK